jgi:hypothetical protein
MPALLSPEKHKSDPTMADTWSLQQDAKLNRGYTLISNDPTKEQGYEIIPDIKTTLVEKNPKRPPHPLDNYANDRSYIRKLAERMDYWVTDPAARLRGGKQRTPGERSDKDRVVDDNVWVTGVKEDIRCLWDNMGVGQDLLNDELQHLRIAFFHECRKTLEKIEELCSDPERDTHTAGLPRLETLRRRRQNHEGNGHRQANSPEPAQFLL